MLEQKTISHPSLIAKPKINRWFLAILSIGIVALVSGPWQSISGLIVLFCLFVASCVLFQEKMLLFFLVTRPALDYWRDATVFRYEEITINVTTVIGVLFFFWGLIMLTKHRRSIMHMPLWLISIVTATFFAITTLYSINPFVSVTEALKFINVIIIFILGFIFVKKNIITSKNILWSIIYSAIIPIIIAINQILSNQGLTTFAIHGRIFGTLAHPNVFAFFLLILIMVHIQYSYITPTNWWQGKKNLKHIITAIGVVLLAMTYTRAAWVGLIVFLVITGILYSKKIIYWLAGVLLIGYVILFPLNQWLWQKTSFTLESYSLVSRITGNNDEADSVQWRQAVARESWPLIGARPWLGYGYGTFPMVWSDNRPITHLWDDSAEAHNDYLRLFLETGIVGLLLYSFFLSNLLIRSLKKNTQVYLNKHIFLTGSIAVFVVISLSDNMLHHTPVMWPLWVLWGAMLAE